MTDSYRIPYLREYHDMDESQYVDGDGRYDNHFHDALQKCAPEAEP